MRCSWLRGSNLVHVTLHALCLHLQAASGADLSAVLCELQSANLGKWTLADVMKHTDARVKEVTG